MPNPRALYEHDQTLQPYPDLHSPRQDCRGAPSLGSAGVCRELCSRAQPLGKRNQFKGDSHTLDSTQKLKRVGVCTLSSSLESSHLTLPNSYCLSTEVWELEGEMMEINRNFCFPFHSSSSNEWWRTSEPTFIIASLCLKCYALSDRD